MIHGILSDAHGNVECFDLAVRLLRGLGARKLLFLGDAVGYLPGNSVLHAIKEGGIDAIRGNHEAMLIGSESCADRDDIYRLIETRGAMMPTLIAAVGRWPTKLAWQAACGPILAVHGSPSDPTNGYVYPDGDLSTFDVAEGATIFMGHTHRPFLRNCRGVRYVNVGSCGLPRDAGSLGCAALFDDETGAVRLIRFDIRDATREALARVGPVHESVLAMFNRPVPLGLVGELHDA